MMPSGTYSPETGAISTGMKRERRGLSWRVRGLIMAQSWSREHEAFLCNYCLSRLTADEVVIDHIKSVSRGGSDEPDNLQVTCWRCNSIKSDMDRFEAEALINSILDAEWEARK